jgi:hypothetical protein
LLSLHFIGGLVAMAFVSFLTSLDGPEQTVLALGYPEQRLEPSDLECGILTKTDYHKILCYLLVCWQLNIDGMTSSTF